MKRSRNGGRPTRGAGVGRCRTAARTVVVFVCWGGLGCTRHQEVVVAVVVGFSRTDDGHNHRQGATFARLVEYRCVRRQDTRKKQTINEEAVSAGRGSKNDLCTIPQPGTQASRWSQNVFQFWEVNLRRRGTGVVGPARLSSENFRLFGPTI